MTAVCTALTLNAQISYDMQLDLVNPVSGSAAIPGMVTVNYSLINNGPDAIPSGDTLYFGYLIGTTIYSLSGVQGSVTGIKIAQAFPVATPISSTMLGIGLDIDLYGVPNGTNVCIAYFGRNAAALTQAGDPTDSDHANDGDCFVVNSVTSVEQIELATSVYPNPANDVLNIVSSEEIASVSIVSLDGKVVATTTNSSVDVSTLISGMYIYEITTTSGKVSRDTFMKK